MKTARFLFTIIGLGALTLGVSHAGEPSSQSSGEDPHKNHATSVRPADPVHGNKDQMDRTSKKSSQALPINNQSKRAPVNEVHQTGLKKAATAANEGLMMNKIRNNHEQRARLPVGSGTTAPLPGAVHARSATVAVIGGLAASSGKHSAAVVNGAAMKRKP
jgi:hypothetical protein